MCLTFLKALSLNDITLWGRVRASIDQFGGDIIQPIISNSMGLVFHRHNWGKAHLSDLNLIRGVMGERLGLPSTSACIRMCLVVAERRKSVW